MITTNFYRRGAESCIIIDQERLFEEEQSIGQLKLDLIEPSQRCHSYECTGISSTVETNYFTGGQDFIECFQSVVTVNQDKRIVVSVPEGYLSTQAPVKIFVSCDLICYIYS